MQITNISDTNFKGLYKIPSKQNYEELIAKYVIPPYRFSKRQPVALLLKGMPQDIALKSALETIADFCHGSLEWLYTNAKNFGVNIPKLDDSIYIISGKTVQDFTDACTNVNSVKTGMKAKLKNIFKIFKSSKKEDDLPEHLIRVKNALNEYYRINGMFDDFFKENKIITKNTPQELYSAMMKE